MSDQKRKNSNRFRFVDLLVILLCLGGAAVCFNLFWLDLFQTINAQNKKPVGVVTIRRNTIQRQLQGRVIWDRPFIGAPLYEGDLLRIAELSTLVFQREEADFEYSDYQMIRIPPVDMDGTFKANGNVVVRFGERGGNVIVNGSRVEARAGTILKSEAGDDGTKIKILEGEKVKITHDGKTQERSAGESSSWDLNGNEKIEPSATVTSPQPNAQFYKSNPENINIIFAWNKRDIERNEALRLEIAENRNFTRIIHVRNYSTNGAQVSLGAGAWYWRLYYGDNILEEERFTIIDAAPPALIYPIKDSILYYNDAAPELCFQWGETAEAVSYLLQVSDTPNFLSARINVRTDAHSYNAILGPGRWYWRVRPVFSSSYTSDTPAISSFSLERGERKELVLPTLIEEPAVEPPAVKVEEPPSLLPAPGSLRPERGYRVSVNELRRQRIVFSWSQVSGANGYIFTLYQQGAGGLRQINRRQLGNRTNITLDNFNILSSGSFFWQVEAINVRRNVIEKRGKLAESSFMLNVPVPDAPNTLRVEELDEGAEDE
jgi:hypothetical protein